MAANHVHVRGEGVDGGYFWPCENADCDVFYSSAWWNGYEAAIANIMANGLPRHEERVAAADAALGLVDQLSDEGVAWEEMARIAINAYHAPLPKEESDG